MARWTVVFSLLTIFLVSHVMATPFIRPMKAVMRELAQRAPEANPVYVKRNNVERQTDLEEEELVARQIPAEVATTSPDGIIKVYGRDVAADNAEVLGRQDNVLPEEEPTTSVDGNIKVYGTRRTLVARQAEIPAEVATTSVNGNIKVYDGTFW